MIDKVSIVTPAGKPVRNVVLSVELDNDYIVRDSENLIVEIMDFIQTADMCKREDNGIVKKITYYTSVRYI